MPEGEAGNDPVARATARAAVLRAEIEQRTRELERLQIYLAVHRDLFDTSIQVDQISKTGTALALSEEDMQPSKVASRTPLLGIRQVDFVPFVRSMILERGRPMNKREIYNGFKIKNRCIGGKPELELKNLGKKLIRAEKEIRHIGGAGYWPVHVPCPEVGYVPP